MEEKEIDMTRKKWVGSSVPTPNDFNRLENLVPVGAFMWYYGREAPNGWVVCDGARITREGWLYRGDTRSEKKLYAALFLHIERQFSSAGDDVLLPNLLQDDIFVGHRKNAIGEHIENAYSSFLPQHAHIVPMSHNHTIDKHCHDMNHRHLMYLMRHDGPKDDLDDYNAFPHEREDERYSTAQKVFGHSVKRYERKHAFSSDSKDAYESTAKAKHTTGEAENLSTNGYDGSEYEIIEGAVKGHRSYNSDAVNIGVLYPKFVVMLPIMKY